MNTASIFALPFVLLIILSCSQAASAGDREEFLKCLSRKFENYSSISNVVYTPNNSSFSSVLKFDIYNLLFATNSTPKPLVIITPEHESQVPPVVLCAKKNNLEVRTRSGGHDYEGMSYVAPVPFVVIDVVKLDETSIDVKEKSAWVGTGVTLGTLYYRIAEQSSTLAFPAGLCLTLGVGGHISGGGYGLLMRKYGLAADNVLDARIVDVNGRILDRKSMGEDLFWAIRGGGGASFGVIVAWKLRLVDVPEKVTVFMVFRTLEQNANQIIQRWQSVAPTIDRDLWIGLVVSPVTSNHTSPTMSANFFSLFLGGADRLLSVMQESFPELGLKREDCIETSWARSALFTDGFPMDSLELLANRTALTRPGLMVKGKTDFVKKPIPEEGLAGIWPYFYEPEGKLSWSYYVPFGGKMDEISESAIPFPHRAGNLYMTLNIAMWPEDEGQNSERYINWVRRIYNYLTPYVIRSPRSAYLNYRDIDLGVNKIEGRTSYAQASRWGKKYFRNNFDRLVRVKTVVDPKNFFRNEQSIPSLWTKKQG